jgi:hypothetical protein
MLDPQENLSDLSDNADNRVSLYWKHISSFGSN